MCPSLCLPDNCYYQADVYTVLLVVYENREAGRLDAIGDAPRATGGETRPESDFFWLPMIEPQRPVPLPGQRDWMLLINEAAPRRRGRALPSVRALLFPV